MTDLSRLPKNASNVYDCSYEHFEDVDFPQNLAPHLGRGATSGGRGSRFEFTDGIPALILVLLITNELILRCYPAGS